MDDKCVKESRKAIQDRLKAQRVCNNIYNQLQGMGILREVEKVMKKKYMKNPPVTYFYRADPNWLD